MMRLVEGRPEAGTAIDATAPYLNGPNTFIQMRTLKGTRRRAPAGSVLDR
jgi:hypothetical protein